MRQDATARPRSGGRSAPRIARLIALFTVVVFAVLPGATRAQESCPANLAPGDSCQAGGSDAGAAPGAGLPSTSVGNPIDLVTGTKLQSEIDLAIDGAELGFRRHYQSTDTDDTTGVGQGWRHTYAVTLAATPDGGRHLTDATGRVVLFGPASEERPGIHPGYLPSDGHVLDAPTGSTWVVPDGRRLSFHGPRLVRIDWPDRRFIALGYGGERADQLVSATDETGRTLRFEWTPGRIGLPGYDAVPFMSHPGHLAALILPDEQRIEYDYDNRRNLTRARFADGTSRVYRYEDEVYRHHLTGLVDRTGTAFASWRYDDDGLAIASGHADGVERVTLAFERPARVGNIGRTRVTDSLGGQSVYTWRRDAATGAGLLLEATGPGCTTCPPTGRRYRYDGARLAAIVELDDADEPAVIRTFTHDDRTRVVRIDETRLDAAGGPVTRVLERREYDGDSHRLTVRATPSVTGQGEHVRTTRFDVAGLPVQLTERGFAPEVDLATGNITGAAPIERTTRLRWRDGLLREIDGPRDDVDDVTRFEHDAAHRLVAIRAPAAPAIRLQDHDAHGRPNTLRIGERSPWRLDRDAEGRVVQVRRGGQSMRYAHDAEGRLVSITDQDDRTVHVAHDAAGRPTRITDDLGRVTTRVHDTESRVVQRSSAGIDGSVIRSLAYLFDANGRLSRSTERRLDANGQPLPGRTLDHERDALGQFTRAIDPATGLGISVELDRVARLATVSTGGRTRTTVAFDAVGRDIALSDARGNTTRYPSDDFGRIVMLDSPDSGRVRYRHDAAGNRTREERSDGGTILYRHDAADRPVERASDDGTARWMWNESDGTLVAVANAATTERFVHDSEARLVGHERDLGGRTFATGYTYDARSRLLDKTLPDGQRLRHHYHDSGPNRGRLRAITRSRWLGLTEETVVGEIDQDGRDGGAGYLSAGGVRTQHMLAPNGQQTEFVVSEAMKLEYTFDANGRISGIVEDGAGSRYGYTAGRLTSISTPPGDTRYSYDATGNRIARLHDPVAGESSALTYRYDEGSNRLLETRDDASGASARYRYDGAGAPLSVGALDYTYDADRRPVAVHRRGELVATYAYSPFGERIRKTVHAGPGATPRITWFLYDGQTLSAEIDETGAVTAQYMYLDDHRAVVKLAGKRVFGIHGDHLGTPRLMSDADGRIVWRASYTPFGEATVELGEEPLALRFPGQYADAETGTHYNYFRDYDPATGRYLTSDPIGLAAGPNTYAYARSSPLMLADPYGLDAIVIAFPDYSPALPAGWPGIGGSRPFSFGHAGILIFDEGSGSTRYYEFGRYTSLEGGGVSGAVRNYTVSDLTMDGNGNPTQASLNRIFSEISTDSGGGTAILGAYVEGADFSAMDAYGRQRIAANSDSERDPYDFLGNNCGHFTYDVLRAGGETDLPGIVFNPSPENLVSELHDEGHRLIEWESPESDDPGSD